MPLPVRVALIGVGGWGKVYIKTLLALGDRCRLTHLGTSNPNNAQLLPYPVEVAREWRQLIRGACDVVIIATPPQTHAEILEACLDAGKPCIVEKPLCMDVATAQQLDARVRASDVPVLVDHTQLFNPYYLALKQALAQSQERIRLIVSEGMAFGPFRTDTPALWDWGPHDLSLCLDVMGKMPEQIDAFAGPRAPDGTPEAASLRLEFANGASAWIQTSRLAPTKRRTLTVITDERAYFLDDTAAVPLTVGVMPFASRYATARLATPEWSAIPPLTQRRPMEQMLTYFLDGLSGGDRQQFGTQLALEITRLLAACDAAMGARQSTAPSRLR